MNLKIYTDLDLYMEDTFDDLSKYALQNNLIIGNCIRAKENGQDTTHYFLGTVSDEEDNLKVIAMQTPPFPLLVFEVNKKPCDEGLLTLIDYLMKEKMDIPGIVSEKELAHRFGQFYIKQVNKKMKPGMNMRIYQLDEVKYRGDVSGSLRKATLSDLYYIPYWKYAFGVECNISMRNDLDLLIHKTELQIEQGTLYVYEDKHPVSLIAAPRKTINGIIINDVYTPPMYRNKGYATAMVADLCTLLLERYQFCGLFTDLSNPTSNKIYQKVGFYPICDFDEVWFTD